MSGAFGDKTDEYSVTIQYILFLYLYNEVGRGDIAREGGEVDSHSPLLVGWQLGIVLVIQGDAGQGSGDGGRVAGVHFLEYDCKEMQRDRE